MICNVLMREKRKKESESRYQLKSKKNNEQAHKFLNFNLVKVHFLLVWLGIVGLNLFFFFSLWKMFNGAH